MFCYENQFNFSSSPKIEVMPLARRRTQRKQHGGAVYTYTKEFHATIFMVNEDSDAHNMFVDLSALDAAELAPLSASICTHLQHYAERLKTAAEYHLPDPFPNGDPIAGLARDIQGDTEAVKDIVQYVDNITYRHVGGDRFEVTFDIHLPDSNDGEPNLGYSNDDKVAQRDNIFDILINSVENFNDDVIEYGNEMGWQVMANEYEIDFGQFDGPFLPHHGHGPVFTNVDQLLNGAEDAGIIPLPVGEVNAVSMDEFHPGEQVIILREAGHDHIFKRDGLLAYFTHMLEHGSQILKNPKTNNELIRKNDPLPDPPIFKHGITIRTGRIAAAGGRRQRVRKTLKRRKQNRAAKTRRGW